jgi:protocatechuate 3,4-dioxygenase beta subunit
MTSQFELDRREMLSGLALGLGGAALAACGSRAGAQAAETCAASPTETRGPFPADGSNGRPRINALAMDGIVRSDIRSSFAGLVGRAEGVPLELNLAVAAARRCGPLAGHAVYLWQNDAAGAYSLYDRTEVNYLRGLQQADGEGRMRFTTVVPGCYGGRYPHCHFEVFESVAAALAGARSLLVSQLAFPEADCRAIYRDDARYGDSLRNLDRQPIERDFVFADADTVVRARQTVIMSGDPTRGYRGAATVVLA